MNAHKLSKHDLLANVFKQMRELDLDPSNYPNCIGLPFMAYGLFPLRVKRKIGPSDFSLHITDGGYCQTVLKKEIGAGDFIIVRFRANSINVEKHERNSLGENELTGAISFPFLRYDKIRFKELNRNLIKLGLWLLFVYVRRRQKLGAN